MLAFITVAILSATGHHAFYDSLSGKNATTGDAFDYRGIKLSNQQFNIAVGNALALLVKTCLSAAVGVAYAQLFWQTVLSQAHQVSQVDTMFTAPYSFRSVTAVRTWWMHPVLFLIAMTAW